MRSTLPPTLNPHSSGHDSRVVGYSDAIEWEELPSLSGSLDRRVINPEVGQARPIVPSVLGAAWDHTMPAELETPAPVSVFHETLEGLSMREVYEPELFRHFFGESIIKG